MKIRNAAHSVLVFVAVMAAHPPQTAHAGALYFYEMSNASESGYGGAGLAARANDAGTVFANPAGMMRFDESAWLAGGVGVYIDGGFQTNNLNTATGPSGSVNKRVVPAGTMSYVRPLNEKWAVGVSAHNYFGLAVDWPGDWVGRANSVNVALLAPQVQPTVAYKANDWLSVGAGAALTLGYMSEKLRQESLTPGFPDGNRNRSVYGSTFSMSSTGPKNVTCWRSPRRSTSCTALLMSGPSPSRMSRAGISF